MEVLRISSVVDMLSAPLCWWLHDITGAGAAGTQHEPDSESQLSLQPLHFPSDKRTTDLLIEPRGVRDFPAVTASLPFPCRSSKGFTVY